MGVCVVVKHLPDRMSWLNEQSIAVLLLNALLALCISLLFVTVRYNVLVNTHEYVHIYMLDHIDIYVWTVLMKVSLSLSYLFGDSTLV